MVAEGCRQKRAPIGMQSVVPDLGDIRKSLIRMPLGAAIHAGPRM